MRVLSVAFTDDADVAGIETLSQETRVLRPRSRNDDSRRNSMAATSTNLEEIMEEDEEENYNNPISKCSQLADASESTGKEVFGFNTPKKTTSSMAMKAQEELSRTPRSNKTTPNSKMNTPKTPRTGNKKQTPIKSSTPGSGCSTPRRGILVTPTSKRRTMVEPETPLSTRKRVKKSLIRIAETVETNRFSDSGSGSSEEEDSSDEENKRPILRGPPATPQTPARAGRRGKGARDLDTTNMAESYFEAQAAKVVTSDRTLNKLAVPRMSQEEVTEILASSSLRYTTEIQELLDDQKEHFPTWMSLLHRSYSIVTYGLGSKKSLIHDFHKEFLSEKDCVVVNGYFPSLTLKSILAGISDDILELADTFSSIPEHLAAILSSVEDDLYLLVHNIDGPMLRNEKAQAVLSELAHHPKIHLVCSIDHINAPLIWDQFKLARFKFIWFDSTTFLPYREEAAGESVMVKASGSLQLASINHVLAALTPNAKRIFMVMANYQIENAAEAHYPGIAFMALYTRCRNEFLVTSDLELKAQLTEFRDHKLVRSKKGGDGAEYLIIPIEKTALASFIETIQDKV